MSRDLQVKVADPGLSYDLHPNDYYRAGDKQRPLPLKWMSLESLDTGVFTPKSDIVSETIVETITAIR